MVGAYRFFVSNSRSSAVRSLKVYIRNVKCSTSSRRGQLQNGFHEPVRSFDPPEFCRTRYKTHFLERGRG